MKNLISAYIWIRLRLSFLSLGGDCDTLMAIAGSLAEGFYGVPAELHEECYKRLPEPLLKVLKMFEEYLKHKNKLSAYQEDV